MLYYVITSRAYHVSQKMFLPYFLNNSTKIDRASSGTYAIGLGSQLSPSSVNLVLARAILITKTKTRTSRETVSQNRTEAASD